MTSVGQRSSGTLGDVLKQHQRTRFVGRQAEIELFRTALDDATNPAFRVLHLHGPGGVGKTSLLKVMAEVSAEAGATVVRLDGHDVEPSSTSVLAALEPVLSVPTGEQPIRLPMGTGRLVLLVDAYELLEPLDGWFRARLLPRLPASAVTVIAGRNAPTAAWRADPSWGLLLRDVSLRNLAPEDSRTFLRKAGVDEDLHGTVLRLTYGHPLGLALLTDLLLRGGAVESDGLPLDLVELLLPRFVETVPDARRRSALATCAVARCTTEALLRHVLGEEEVHDLFSWLRGLSFVESRPDGLAPHDLARDVLDADLRWRDFDSYRRVFERVREHCLAGLRTDRGREQQRAIFDLKFLFHRVRAAMSPVEWESWGQHYPRPAGAVDRDPIIELVRTWEGDGSAAIAARWLDRQPDAFSVLHDQDGKLQGTVAIVELTRSSLEDIEADPGAKAAWEFAHRTAPPRPGEAVTLCRFVVDRRDHQRPSPTLNAAPIVTLQKQLTTPHLSWDFLALADPDKWNEYFAAADLPRAEGADFSVGGQHYGLFAHDFRRVSVEAMTQVWTERALTQDMALSPRAHADACLVLSRADFEAAVRQGFKDLRRPDALARNPLVRTRLVLDRGVAGTPGAPALVGVLREAAAATLGQHPRDDRLLRAVDRTYLHPAATQEAAAAVLGLPFSTYRRHLTQGMTRIVSALWDQEVYGRDRPEVSSF
jgi:hypothetical protein